jgi:hypothetical protein
MDPLSPIQWRLYNHNVRNLNLWSFSNVSKVVNIDIVFYGPQILIPYIMIVEAPL